MPRARNPRGKLCRSWLAAISLTLCTAGCNTRKPPVYEDGQGFHFAPPAGWVERARDDALPAKMSHRQQNLPLPPLGPASHPRERLLVRYDRTSTSDHAWLRASVADLPASTPLRTCLSACAPGAGWKLQAEESLEVNGLPAARIVFGGRWYDRDYHCETVAVRKEEKVYLFSAAFPATDDTGREQVRQAILHASWER